MRPGKTKPAFVMAICERYRQIHCERDQLRHRMGEAEAELIGRHAWFSLTHTQRRLLPAAQAFYEIEEELARLDRESAQLVISLRAVPALSLNEAIAKLDVVARVIEPDDYADAHAVLARAINELQAL
jgi:hypothetical protein